MNKKQIVLGINRPSNIAAFLQRDFLMISPEIKVIGNEVKTNFDYLLQFDEEIRNISSLDLDVIGSKRFSKITQSMILTQLGINTPKIYGNIITDYLGIDVLSQLLLNEFDDETELILKANNGARGLGQTIINRENLNKLFDEISGPESNETVIKEIEKKYLVGGNEGDMKDFLINTIKDGNFHFAEFIDVKEEYRIIGLYGSDPIIIKREVSKKYWQANASITEKGEYIKNHPLITGFRTISDTLLEQVNSPWLSIDIYIDGDGNIGVFEFQMEMGYTKVPKKLLVDSINKAMKNYISKKFK